MWFSNDDTEKKKTFEHLYNEVNCLVEQQETLKKKIEDSYPIIDSLIKIKKELEEEKTKNRKLENRVTDVESLRQYNEQLEKEIQDLKSRRWFWLFFLLAGVMFLLFSAYCSWKLLSLINEYSNWQILIPIMIGIVMVLMIMAAVLMYFAYKTHQYLIKTTGINNIRRG